MAENKDQDERHLSDDPTPIEELVKQVVASAAPHPNMPPLPYSLQKMKNVVMQLVNFKAPRSHDWSTEPRITPLQIEALREIKRLFLESRAYYKLLHGIYTPWRDHRVELRPSEGSFFKAVTQEQLPFHDAHPLFKVFWGSHEGILSWSGEDVIPVMRELVRNLIEREAVVPPIPAELVVVENEEVVATDEVVGMIAEESIVNNFAANENMEAGKPNRAAAEVLEVEDGAQGTGVSDIESDETGEKENQPAFAPMEGTESVKPIQESLVGTRSLSSSNLVRDAATTSLLSDESDLRNTIDVPAAPPQGESNSSCKTNSIIIAAISDNAETSVTTSSKGSIPTTLSSLSGIEAEHSYAKPVAQKVTESIVLADIFSVWSSDVADMVVDHEEEVETTAVPAKSSSKRHERKRSSKKESQLDTARKQAKKTKFDEKVTGKNENCHRNSTECPTPIDLANKILSEEAASIDVSANLGNTSSGSVALSRTGSQPICTSGGETSQARIGKEVTADTIAVLVSDLIDLVVKQEAKVDKTLAKKIDQGDGQEDVSSQNASAQPNPGESDRMEIDEQEVVVIPEAASSNTECQENQSVEDQLNFGPTVRRNRSQQVTIEPDSEGKEEIKKLCKSFQYRNKKLVNEKKELLVRLENVLEIQQGTEAYQKLKRCAEKELEKSGLLDDIHLEEIHSFLLNYVCDPWYEEDSNFPRQKNVRAPCARQLFIEWDRSKNNGCPRKSSKEFSKWHKEYDKRYLIWLQLKNKVDEITKKQIKSGVITGRLEKRKMSKESKQMGQDKDTTEPPPKRRHTRRVRPSSSSVTNSSDIPEEQQCFWMVSSDC